MNNIDFGSIGVDVANCTLGSIHDLLIENGLSTFIDRGFFSDDHVYSNGNWLQTVARGVIYEKTYICVLNGYVHYVTDMDTFLLILRTAVLDLNLANELVNDLYYQGLIKPRGIL